MGQSSTITATVPVWASERVDPTRLSEGDPVAAIGRMTIYKPGNERKWIADGYTKVGEAEVIVHLIDRDTMVQHKVESLRAEKTKTLADAQAKATAIDGQIQSLLAIEYTPEAA